MKELLYLSHRIPFPPDKGDKIRSYHLLSRLAERWTVHLGTFIDDEDDWQHVDTLSGYCGETKFLRLNPTTAKIRSMRALVDGTSLTMPYYRNRELQRWVEDLMVRRDIECVVVFSSPMAQYVLDSVGGEVRTVIDFCDMDSDKWRQYSDRFSGIKRWIYGREADRLRVEETAVAERADASVFISEDESAVFCEQTGTPEQTVFTVPNGVDTVYFDPAVPLDNPYAADSDPMVFVGAMDYWPNIDAVLWFADKVFPAVREANAKAEFHIVGSNPRDDVCALGQRPGINVTGRVEDVRPYVKHSRCVVAPLRIARGVQNKVLEAMAMAKPIVATNAALEGISLVDGLGIRVCEQKADWVEALQSQTAGSVPADQPANARQHVADHYSWDASASQLTDIISG